MYFADTGFLPSLTEHLIEPFLSVVSINILPILALFGIMFGIPFILVMLQSGLNPNQGSAGIPHDEFLSKGYSEEEYDWLLGSKYKYDDIYEDRE